NVEEGHVLARHRSGDASVSSMEGAPPVGRVIERLVTYTPRHVVDGLRHSYRQSDGYARRRGEGHRPVDVEIHVGAAIAARAHHQALHERSPCRLVDPRPIPGHELDGRVHAWTSFVTPVDMQAGVAEAHLVSVWDVKLDGPHLAGTG